MAKKEKSAMQWKVIKGVSLEALASTCEEWTGKGWNVFTIMGPFSGGMVMVVNRMLTL